jgi:hypothetical protein
MSTFSLLAFDEFFDTYKATNTLIPEALMALANFLSALNEFFNLSDNLNKDIVMNYTTIHWYSYTNMVTSGDYIQAKSKYYYTPEFSNVLIKMNEQEIDDYNTDESSCFDKVYIPFEKLHYLTLISYLIYI